MPHTYLHIYANAFSYKGWVFLKIFWNTTDNISDSFENFYSKTFEELIKINLDSVAVSCLQFFFFQLIYSYFK